MSLSQHEERMIKLQYQMRENNQDLHEFIKDLDTWESDVRKKEEQLTQTQHSKKPTSDLPPVRNSLQKKKVKKKKKPNDGKTTDAKKKKIPGYDYRAWDKFDVEKALEDAEKEEEKSSSEYETDEEWEIERNKHLATQEKDKGNEFFKKGDLEAAVECYTRGISLDPTNALLPANRAMALLKQGKFGAAEVDCTSALALDPLYIKAYLRRASARTGLGKYQEAQSDYRNVLKLEPHNKPAQTEVEKLEKEIARSKEAPLAMTTVAASEAIVKPIHKPVEMRSKKPLRRIAIEEIGVEDKDAIRDSIARAQAAQGQTTKRVSAKDQEDFDRLLGTAEPKPAPCSPAELPTLPSMSTWSPASVTSLVDGNSPAAGEKKCVIQEISEMAEENPVESASFQGSNKKMADAGSPRSLRSDESLQPPQEQGQRKLGDQAKLGGGDASSKPAAETRPVPTTSFQFQTDYKSLKSSIPAFYQYFKRINPCHLPHLFGACLESSTLMTILKAVQQCYMPDGEDYLPLLQWLPKVKRFSTTVMFLSPKEKQVLTDIFQHLKNSTAPQDEVEKLCRTYDML